MAKNIVSGTETASNTTEQEMMEVFRALDMEGQHFVLRAALGRRRSLEKWMNETGLPLEDAGDRFHDWALAKIFGEVNAAI